MIPITNMNTWSTMTPMASRITRILPTGLARPRDYANFADTR